MLVNGSEMSFGKEINVLELLAELKVNPDRVVVEVDMDIIPREQYETKKLSTDSKVEVISFVGGG